MLCAEYVQWWLMIVLYKRWRVFGYVHIENHLLHLQLGDQPSPEKATETLGQS